ncbi:MAG: extracellular solute-binding protein [Lachnospiraceae bacterium]|nr:extracellular solute-binding protein [Lachnospiraceae bacterium]
MKLEKVVVITAVIVGTLAVAACVWLNMGEQKTDAEQNESTTLDWYVNFSWFHGNWGENLVSKAITDQTDVSVRFSSPSGNESEKLDALINANALPDLITLGCWEPQVQEMIDKNMVYAYNELAGKYDSQFWEVADEKALKWYTNEDGNVYCYPNSFYTPQDLETYHNISSNETFLVRKDIYEAIGSPDMSTQEGFEAAVKKAVELYPQVDGRPLIPIGAHVFDNMGCVSFDKYLMDFLAVPMEKDGEIYDRYTDPEYLSWLKFFRRLGEEGYLAPDIFVDTRTQMDEKIGQGRYFCMMYQYTDILDQQKSLAAENPERIYIAVDGPGNSRGEDPRLSVNGMNGWTVTLISRKCKDPEKAIKFVEYLISEKGQMETYLGTEGVTYEVVDGKVVLNPEVQELLNTDRKAYDEKYGADYCYWMFQDLTMPLKYPQETPDYVSQLKEWSWPYAAYAGQYDYQPTQKIKDSAMYDELNQLWGETLPSLLLADSDEEFDRIVSEAVVQREKMGFSKVQAEKTENMKRAKEKLDMR